MKKLALRLMALGCQVKLLGNVMEVSTDGFLLAPIKVIKRRGGYYELHLINNGSFKLNLQGLEHWLMGYINLFIGLENKISNLIEEGIIPSAVAPYFILEEGKLVVLDYESKVQLYSVELSKYLDEHTDLAESIKEPCAVAQTKVLFTRVYKSLLSITGLTSLKVMGNMSLFEVEDERGLFNVFIKENIVTLQGYRNTLAFVVKEGTDIRHEIQDRLINPEKYYTAW